jgi:hypothetical protein
MLTMEIDLLKNEVIIKKGKANHFKGLEAVGGNLYLTNYRVIFKSHFLNIQTHTESYPLDEITDMGKRNTLGIVPNGFFLKMKNGQIEKFVVWGRSKWLAKIKDSIQNYLLFSTLHSFHSLASTHGSSRT